MLKSIFSINIILLLSPFISIRQAENYWELAAGPMITTEVMVADASAESKGGPAMPDMGGMM